MGQRKASTVDRCQQIRAFHQKAERYQGLQLEYDRSSMLRKEILRVFERVKAETGLDPEIYEDITLNGQKLFYIEFHDEYEREGGRFFDQVRRGLGIDGCMAQRQVLDAL